MRVIEHRTDGKPRYESVIRTSYNEMQLLDFVMQIGWLSVKGPHYVEQVEPGTWVVLTRSGILLAHILEK